MPAKKRKWSENYAQYGFTCATKSDGTRYPQCMLCNVKLSNSSLAPAKLRDHFTKVHGTGKYKDTPLTQFKQKRARLIANMLPLHLVVLFQWINRFHSVV